jgi:hypothetical protein
MHDRHLTRPEDRRFGGRDPDRRKPDLVPLFEAVFGLDPAAVDPDLAAAEHPVNMAFWHALEDPQQEIVDALPCPVLPDFKPRSASLA